MKRFSKSWLMAVAMVMVLAMIAVGYAALPAPEEKTNGTITDLYPDSMMFVIADMNGNQQKFELDENAQIFLNDRVAHLQDLIIGDRVGIYYWVDEATWYALEVRCQR